MNEPQTFGVWIGGFILGSLVYLLLAVILVRRSQDAALRLVCLGILTAVFSALLSGLPHGGAMRIPHMEDSLVELMATPGAAILSRIGLILVLAGLAGYLWRPDGQKDKPDSTRSER